MWIHLLAFLNLVAENWQTGVAGNSQYVLAQNLKSMKQVLKVWNKNEIRDIKFKIQVVESLVQQT